MSGNTLPPAKYQGEDIGVDEADFWLDKIEKSEKMHKAMIAYAPKFGFVLIHGTQSQTEQAVPGDDPETTLEVA